MTIYNIHPKAGCLTNVRFILTHQIGLSPKDAGDVIRDIRKMYKKRDIKGLYEIMDFINRNFSHPVVYCKKVKHWNRGTTYISSRR